MARPNVLDGAKRLVLALGVSVGLLLSSVQDHAAPSQAETIGGLDTAVSLVTRALPHGRPTVADDVDVDFRRSFSVRPSSMTGARHHDMDAYGCRLFVVRSDATSV